ncbi:hypothetical protein ACFQS7_28970 [Dankookia sp. GCM10030260]|uniref:hypothetical protein n=1 Tax=Dankookia sp. GCM10030260 TaxID=3273390 RepID=UPI00360CF8BA
MAESSTKHVAAYRERMRQAGYKRLQVELHLEPERHALLTAYYAERAEQETRAQSFQRIFTLGLEAVSLPDAERRAVLDTINAHLSQCTGP